MATASFSLENCSILFGAVLDGFADGDAISIDPMGDRWGTMIGSAGDLLFVDTGQKAFTITLNLMQSSASNALLNAAYLADTTTPGGILLPFTFKDPNANDVFFSPKARIMKLPTFARGNKGNMQAWTIVGADGIQFYGGVGSPV